MHPDESLLYIYVVDVDSIRVYDMDGESPVNGFTVAVLPFVTGLISVLADAGGKCFSPATNASAATAFSGRGGAAGRPSATDG